MSELFQGFHLLFFYHLFYYFFVFIEFVFISFIDFLISSRCSFAFFLILSRAYSCPFRLCSIFLFCIIYLNSSSGIAFWLLFLENLTLWNWIFEWGLVTFTFPGSCFFVRICVTGIRSLWVCVVSPLLFALKFEILLEIFSLD